MALAVARRGSGGLRRRQQSLGDVVAHRPRRDVGETGEIGEAVRVVRHGQIMTVLRATVKTIAHEAKTHGVRGR